MSIPFDRRDRRGPGNRAKGCGSTGSTGRVRIPMDRSGFYFGIGISGGSRARRHVRPDDPTARAVGRGEGRRVGPQPCPRSPGRPDHGHDATTPPPNGPTTASIPGVQPDSSAFPTTASYGHHESPGVLRLGRRPCGGDRPFLVGWPTVDTSEGPVRMPAVCQVVQGACVKGARQE